MGEGEGDLVTSCYWCAPRLLGDFPITTNIHLVEHSSRAYEKHPRLYRVGVGIRTVA